MSKSFNIGEWTELYVFLKLLCEGKIYRYSSKLDLQDNMFTLLEIFREEASSCAKYTLEREYIRKNKDTYIEYKNIILFRDILFKKLTTKNLKGTLTIAELDDFFTLIGSETIKSGSSYQKADIALSFSSSDMMPYTKLGFSIKSYIGCLPTLLNASQSTVYF